LVCEPLQRLDDGALGTGSARVTRGLGQGRLGMLELPEEAKLFNQLVDVNFVRLGLDEIGHRGLLHGWLP
jgi:hypothetical protein